MEVKEVACISVLLVVMMVGMVDIEGRTITTSTIITKRWWIFDYLNSYSKKPSLHLPGHCYPEVEARVVGGFVVRRNAWPWVVAIRGLAGPVRCGGVLITSRHALTAAHCVPAPFLSPWVFRVVVGAHTHKDGIEIGITVASIHPNFGVKSNHDSDIAVLTLSADITPSQAVQPICITSGTPPVGAEGVVLGWGRTGYMGFLSGALRGTTVSVLPSFSCDKYGRNFTDTMLCAGQPGRDACVGDSGGPLVVNVGGMWVLVGVVAYGRGCGSVEFPGVYTNLVPFKRWIGSVLF